MRARLPQVPTLVLCSVFLGKPSYGKRFHAWKFEASDFSMEAGDQSSMRCLYCGARLPLLRELHNGDFCSDAHREAWEHAQHECASLEEARFAADPQFPRPGAAKIRLFPLRHLVTFSSGPTMVDIQGVPQIRPDIKSVRYRGEPEPCVDFVPPARSRFAGWSPRWSAGRVLVLALLAGFLFLLRWGMPDLTASTHSHQAATNPLDRSWSDLRQNIMMRAAVDLNDDFRAGLDDWQTRPGATGWTYDESGFALPHNLALYKPSLELTDYRMEFLGQLEKKGMGWAVRAADQDNYEAVRIVVTHAGPLPLADLIHYSVVDGQIEDRVEKPLPLTIRTDMLFRARMDVQGDGFALIIQGQIVDFWTDGRLRRGGVGFFCQKGEVARLRWVEISHQYDMLGRLCAYLTPYGMSSANGSWSR